MMASGWEAIAIVGPTATGKTALALAVARELGGEVVSVDSRQAYRGMEVGTAAPARGERREVVHYGVGFLDPRRRYSAGAFSRFARRWIADIRERGGVPILAGGTGFFLRALLDPVFREPRLEPERRRALRRWLKDQPPARVLSWAYRLDPGLRGRLVRLDGQRAARALELALLSGHPLTWWQEHGEPEARPLHIRCYCLSLPAGVHRERIRARADALLQGGWLEEVERLRTEASADAPVWSAVGYRDVLALADGRLTRDEALERIVRATWAYARRQRTWFRHQMPEHTVTLDARLPTRQLARRLASDWREGR
ncbi:MAG: tRNA (adenosine(37)-N6)-dimethylallyltransferase MiaA [Gemmatimonadota bacterium]